MRENENVGEKRDVTDSVKGIAQTEGTATPWEGGNVKNEKTKLSSQKHKHKKGERIWSKKKEAGHKRSFKSKGKLFRRGTRNKLTPVCEEQSKNRHEKKLKKNPQPSNCNQGERRTPKTQARVDKTTVELSKKGANAGKSRKGDKKKNLSERSQQTTPGKVAIKEHLRL